MVIKHLRYSDKIMMLEPCSDIIQEDTTCNLFFFTRLNLTMEVVSDLFKNFFNNYSDVVILFIDDMYLIFI